MLEFAKMVSVGGGMRKRISCNVIRTIPLSKSSCELRPISRSNDKSHKISDAAGTPNTKKCVRESTANAQFKHSGNSVTYTNRLDITRMSIDNGLTAQMLDFYV